jgi:hypothetical protein
MAEKIPKWLRIILVAGFLTGFVCCGAFYGASDKRLSDTDEAIILCLSAASLGSLVVMGLALANLFNKEQKKALSTISLIIIITISGIVFLGSAFWQFLGLGLAGVYQPCLVNLVAFGIISFILVVRAIRIK